MDQRLNNESFLSWNENTQIIIKKANSRQYCLIKLQTFNVNSDILQLFFSPLLCSILTFGFVSWRGNITQGDKKQNWKTDPKKGEGSRGRNNWNYEWHAWQMNIQYSKVNHILNDDTHPMWKAQNPKGQDSMLSSCDCHSIC